MGGSSAIEEETDRPADTNTAEERGGQGEGRGRGMNAGKEGHIDGS